MQIFAKCLPNALAAITDRLLLPNRTEAALLQNKKESMKPAAINLFSYTLYQSKTPPALGVR
jgi:hypothetical protein